MKATTILLAVGAALLTNLSARTWTSSDGEKTFDGEVVSYDIDGQTVEVRMANGRSVKFAEGKLSADDVAFLKEWHAETNKPDVEELLAEQVIGKKLSKAKIHQLDGKRFKKVELETAPEYYILYYSASW